MVKKTLLCCLLLLIVNFYLRDIYKPNIVLSQSQWQDNLISAQDYLYSELDTIDNVIVGSSMALRLTMDSLPSFYNLSFAGETLEEGLGLIIHKGVFPKRVFIETNTLTKVTNSSFNSSLYNPVLAPLREKLIFMRDGRQPIPLLNVKFKENIIDHIIPASINLPILKTQKDKDQTINWVKTTTQQVLTPKQSEKIEEVRKLIDILTKNNVDIVFFEMPEDRIDCNSQIIPLYRTITQQAYPLNRYTHFPTPKCGEYKTTDGVHLTLDEAKKYTSHFKAMVDSLILHSK